MKQWKLKGKIQEDVYDYDYGLVGDVTNMTYRDGSHMQVGDVVELFNEEGKSYGETFVVKNSPDKYFIMGIEFASNNNTVLGKANGGWSVKLVKKFHEVTVGTKLVNIKSVVEEDTHIAIIDGKTYHINTETYLQITGGDLL